VLAVQLQRRLVGKRSIASKPRVTAEELAGSYTRKLEGICRFGYTLLASPSPSPVDLPLPESSSTSPCAQPPTCSLFLSTTLRYAALTFRLVIDLSSILPSFLVTPLSRSLVSYHLERFQDQFFTSPPAWFTVYMWLELVYHVPVSLWLGWGLWNGEPQRKAVCERFEHDNLAFSTNSLELANIDSLPPGRPPSRPPQPPRLRTRSRHHDAHLPRGHLFLDDIHVRTEK
jgi:hypothetical protein